MGTLGISLFRENSEESIQKLSKDFNQNEDEIEFEETDQE